MWPPKTSSVWETLSLLGSYLRCRLRELADSLHSSQFPVTIFTNKHRWNADVVVAGFTLSVKGNRLETYPLTKPRRDKLTQHIVCNLCETWNCASVLFFSYNFVVFLRLLHRGHRQPEQIHPVLICAHPLVQEDKCLQEVVDACANFLWGEAVQQQLQGLHVLCHQVDATILHWAGQEAQQTRMPQGLQMLQENETSLFQ